MKKILTVCIVISAFYSSAQTWAPIGATWYYSETHYFLPLVDYYKVESVGDTLINGISCKVLHKNSYVCDLRPLTEYMYDSSNHVYFWDAAIQSFQMLYNFDAAAGDSWKIYTGYPYPQDTILYTVDSTSLISINGFSRKILYISNNFFGQETIIEGIGSTKKLFNWDAGFCDGSWAAGIRCYEDANIGLVDFDTLLSCDTIYYTGIEEHSSEYNFTIFPIPIESEMFVQQTGGKFFPSTFKLFNLVGENVLSGELNVEKNRIDLSAILSGTYFIRISSKDKNFFKKIIKL